MSAISRKHMNVITESHQRSLKYLKLSSRVADGSFSKILILLKGSYFMIANNDKFPHSDRLALFIFEKTSASV